MLHDANNQFQFYVRDRQFSLPKDVIKSFPKSLLCVTMNNRDTFASSPFDRDPVLFENSILNFYLTSQLSIAEKGHFTLEEVETEFDYWMLPFKDFTVSCPPIRCKTMQKTVKVQAQLNFLKYWRRDMEPLVKEAVANAATNRECFGVTLNPVILRLKGEVDRTSIFFLVRALTSCSYLFNVELEVIFQNDRKFIFGKHVYVFKTGDSINIDDFMNKHHLDFQNFRKFVDEEIATPLRNHMCQWVDNERGRNREVYGFFKYSRDEIISSSDYKKEEANQRSCLAVKLQKEQRLIQVPQKMSSLKFFLPPNNNNNFVTSSAASSVIAQQQKQQQQQQQQQQQKQQQQQQESHSSKIKRDVYMNFLKPLLDVAVANCLDYVLLPNHSSKSLQWLTTDPYTFLLRDDSCHITIQSDSTINKISSTVTTQPNQRHQTTTRLSYSAALHAELCNVRLNMWNTTFRSLFVEAANAGINYIIHPSSASEWLTAKPQYGFELVDGNKITIPRNPLPDSFAFEIYEIFKSAVYAKADSILFDVLPQFDLFHHPEIVLQLPKCGITSDLYLERWRLHCYKVSIITGTQQAKLIFDF